MSLHHVHTVTIACDYPTKCARTFGPLSNVPAVARKEAAAAGWHIGANDKAHCPEHRVALGIRTRAAT